jgi:hypothetical protein
VGRLGNAIVSQPSGFESWPTFVEGSLANYENLANVQTGIHDYFKFLKFGFGRATDLACMHVRRGRLSREDAVRMVQQHDGTFPWTYLGVPLEQVLDELGMTVDEFVGVCDRFTNKRLFVCDRRGELVTDSKDSLTTINDDNA